MSEQKFKELYPEEFNEEVRKYLEKHQYANTFKLGFDENDFYISFGHIEPKELSEEENEEENEGQIEVEVVSRIKLPADLVLDLIGGLYQAGCTFEEEHEKEIGFEDIIDS